MIAYPPEAEILVTEQKIKAMRNPIKVRILWWLHARPIDYLDA